MRCSTWKKTPKAAATMLFAILGLAGLPNQTLAFQFNSGDLVLAIFGNNQEYITDLGPISSVLPASGLTNTFNIGASALNPLAATTGSQPIQWSLLEYQGTNAATNVIYAASSRDAAMLTALGNNSVNGQRNNMVAWNGFLTTAGGGSGSGAEVLLSSTDPASFTSRFGMGGDLNGSFVGPMQGDVDTLVNLIRGQNAGGNILSDAGRAILSASGQLTICGGAGCSISAVPLPAAVVLFGSGLIGLVGIARRKVSLLSA